MERLESVDGVVGAGAVVSPSKISSGVLLASATGIAILVKALAVGGVALVWS